MTASTVNHLTPEQAMVVLQAMDSGGWKITRNPASPYLKESANRDGAWLVERSAYPFCNGNGERIWFGPDPITALNEAQSSFTPQEFTIKG